MRTVRVLAAALAATTLAGSAFAADLPSRRVAPAPVYAPAPIFTWTGFYVGLQAGGVWDKVSYEGNNAYLYSLLFPVATNTVWWGYNNNNTKSGFVGGGHVGYNYQISSFVLGLEGDIEGATVWNGVLRSSIRGRLGFALDRALVYATGGLAIGSSSGSNNYGYWGYNWGGNQTSTRVGWTVGGGVEYAFTPNWSAGVEYRYSDLGKNTGNTGAWGYNYGGNMRVTENAVRARVSYHFNTGYSAPVLAKY
jgi:outer membrane immunogenic protein